jgi:hypothetical protein
LPRKALKIGDEYFVPGPIAKVKQVANDYMANRDTPSYHKQPEKYHPLDEDHSRAIAKAFDEMKHEPDNPAVKHSYEAMINETKAQYKAIEKTGLKIEPIEPGMPDPYAANPRLAAKDVADNNHLWYFPTDQGFGSPKSPNINWNRERVGLGGPPVGKDRVVMDVPVRDLMAAHKATDKGMFVEKPKQRVLDHMEAGKPISLPEVSVYNGQVRYTNGRNRVAAAHEMGAETVPVAVDRDSVEALNGFWRSMPSPAVSTCRSIR